MALQRLVDCGQLKTVQVQSSYPVRFATSGSDAYDLTDDLAATICAVLRVRDEGFTDEAQLRDWITGDGEQYDERLFALAVRQLKLLGRLQQSRTPDASGERLWWLIEAQPHRDELLELYAGE